MIQKRKKLYFIMLLSIFTVFGAWIGKQPVLTTEAMAMDQEYEGYLITAHSSGMHENPGKITKECILMPECAASGYGISVKQSDGSYQFYKFDGNGQKLAKDILAKTAKESGILVIAKGTLDGGILKVTSLTEKILQKPVAIVLSGWLIETSCNGTNDPDKHTKECCLMKDCAASGYGIIVKQADGSFTFYKFDAKGHQLAADYLNKTAKKDNLTITVKGIWDGDILKVLSFAEKN
ncbi:MAG TPA: hypothetical protein DDW50_12090 [Firmicutes bacterium]|nr:hypothetical protein [Bacillota bacterium]